ncbi:hypothetical protein TSAR_006215 [Trichomalopsis sarcophagae]|uniref:EF-hand domain-containing protein n=1 Tax=Trichomalopsis sarcophagae TaxID=543379 RepID=A0A232EZE3_9HYME|nr:hypothetical protein TSAR_006215 [Trichomalopsis sarcophagae]
MYGKRWQEAKDQRESRGETRDEEAVQVRQCLHQVSQAQQAGINNSDGFLDLVELKRMIEVLGAPQTHLGFKDMIQKVDENGDRRISPGVSANLP